MSPTPATNLYFGPSGRECSAWLHRSAQPARVGLVICGSFGREDLCLHRSLRHVAESAASRGMAALRFDYPGTGDSAGSEFAPDLVGRWLASIADAVATLRQQTGVTEVCLLGVRLGALLAARAAAERCDIAGLVAIAPAASGRAYVRELKAYSQASASFGCKLPTARDDGLLEAGGFAMDAHTQEALRCIDLTKELRAPTYPTLIIERDDLPSDHRWLEHLRGLGASATSLRIPGYEGMVREWSPHRTVVPTQMIESVLSWVEQLGPTEARSGQMPEAHIAVTKSLRWPALPSVELVEEVENIDIGTHLSAWVTRAASPVPDNTARRAIVLLSGGADRRIGPGRLFVHLAREWATMGFVVLRLDLSGMGESPPRTGFDENLPYLPHALDDIDAAVRHLREKHQVSHCQLVGHCAGAYNAFRSAVKGSAVDAVILINPLLYLQVRGRHVNLDDRKLEIVASSRNYRRRLTDWERWRALLTNPQKIWNVIRNIVAITGEKTVRRARDVLRLSGIQLKDDLPSELLLLARRNTKIRLVFSEAEDGEMMLWSLGGSTVKRLIKLRQLTITASSGADHLYTLLHHREALFRALTKMIDSVEAEEARAEVFAPSSAFSVSRNSMA